MSNKHLQRVTKSLSYIGQAFTAAFLLAAVCSLTKSLFSFLYALREPPRPHGLVDVHGSIHIQQGGTAMGLLALAGR